MKEGTLTPEEVMAHLASRLSQGIRDTSIRRWDQGKKRVPHYTLWVELDRDFLKPAIQALMEIQFPHLSVIAGADLGDAIRLLYIFSIQYGSPKSEYMVTFAIPLPKSDPTVPTISDLIPGAVFSEREKQEFFGIRVTGIPDNRRLFLPEDFPDGVFPWRKDGTGVQEGMVKDLWKSKRPENRPAPPVEGKRPGTAAGEGTPAAAPAEGLTRGVEK
ncbi:MAG: NADH-quinone oxidoreductase subunit C [Methanolinea sp.]|nr:NADH-quinone oxidoreductase subunit C [Methanolinea sp.]